MCSLKGVDATGATAHRQWPSKDAPRKGITEGSEADCVLLDYRVGNPSPPIHYRIQEVAFLWLKRTRKTKGQGGGTYTWDLAALCGSIVAINCASSRCASRLSFVIHPGRVHPDRNYGRYSELCDGLEKIFDDGCGSCNGFRLWCSQVQAVAVETRLEKTTTRGGIPRLVTAQGAAGEKNVKAGSAASNAQDQ
jgi:hypothetical protein